MLLTTWMGLGYYMMIFLAGLQNIPEDPFEFDDALDDATYDDPDTWDEVESMYYAKGLTREEYFALLRSTQEAKAGASPPTNAGESEGGQ